MDQAFLVGTRCQKFDNRNLNSSESTKQKVDVIYNRNLALTLHEFEKAIKLTERTDASWSSERLNRLVCRPRKSNENTVIMKHVKTLRQIEFHAKKLAFEGEELFEQARLGYCIKPLIKRHAALLFNSPRSVSLY